MHVGERKLACCACQGNNEYVLSQNSVNALKSQLVGIQKFIDISLSAQSFCDYVIHFWMAKGGKGWMLCSRSMMLRIAKARDAYEQ